MRGGFTPARMAVFAPNCIVHGHDVAFPGLVGRDRLARHPTRLPKRVGCLTLPGWSAQYWEGEFRA